MGTANGPIPLQRDDATGVSVKSSSSGKANGRERERERCEWAAINPSLPPILHAAPIHKERRGPACIHKPEPGSPPGLSLAAPAGGPARPRSRSPGRGARSGCGAGGAGGAPGLCLPPVASEQPRSGPPGAQGLAPAGLGAPRADGPAEAAAAG